MFLVRSRFLGLSFLVILIFTFWGASSLQAEEGLWKGEPSPREITAGALIGAALVDGEVGFAVLGNIAKKVVHKGFAPDLNNQVFVELAMGPIFIQGSTVFFYSFHGRWDFHKDLDWTFYGLAGLGGQILTDELGGGARIFPRTGVGFVRTLGAGWNWRAELSHEIIGTGVSFDF